MTSATIQPSIACGPPSAVISSGIVMNGPIPIMLIMFRAVAWTRPKRRGRGAEDTARDPAMIAPRVGLLSHHGPASPSPRAHLR